MAAPCVAGENTDEQLLTASTHGRMYVHGKHLRGNEDVSGASRGYIWCLLHEGHAHALLGAWRAVHNPWAWWPVTHIVLRALRLPWQVLHRAQGDTMSRPCCFGAFTCVLVFLHFGCGT